MHAKIAASRGSSMSMDWRNFSRTSTVNGARLGRLDDSGGASLLAPSKSALYSGSLMLHSSPCRTFQALIAAA